MDPEILRALVGPGHVRGGFSIPLRDRGVNGQERQHVVGKEGSERLRFELVQIIQNIIRPAKVHTILFKDLIVQ